MPQSPPVVGGKSPVAEASSSSLPTPLSNTTPVGASSAVPPPGHVNVAGAMVRKDGLVANQGLRALEASPMSIGQWCPRNDDPTHPVLGCGRIHRNALAAGTNAAGPVIPMSPSTGNSANKPAFPNQPLVNPSAQQQGGPAQTAAQMDIMGGSVSQPGTVLLTETQRRAAIGAAVSSGGVGGFRRPVGGEKLRKNQIAAQILRAASDTSNMPAIAVSTAATAAPPASGSVMSPAVSSGRNNASFGNPEDVLGAEDNWKGVNAEMRANMAQRSGRPTSAMHRSDVSGSPLHPHLTAAGSHFHPHHHVGAGDAAEEAIVDPRSFQARFPHVVHMCVAHTFNLEDMMTLFRDDLDYNCEMCYDVLHVWREGVGAKEGGSAMKPAWEGGDGEEEWDVMNRDTSALLNEEGQNPTATTTHNKRGRRGPGHHHRSHHRRGPRVGEGNPRASAVTMRKPFNLFLFEYGSVVFWGAPEVYAEIVEPFISDSVGTGGGSGGQASSLRTGAKATASDYNAPINTKSRKAAHRVVAALERAMGQRYPKDVILDRFPVRCSYEIAAFGADHGGVTLGEAHDEYHYNPDGGQVAGYDSEQQPALTAGEAAAREAEMFKRSLLRNHHFIIPAVSDSIPMLCIAHALAQAAKVDVLEGMINQLMEQCHPLPTQLKDDGFVRITEKHLLQLRGEVLFYRMQLRGGSDLQAEPEPIWHFPAMESFYLITREVFEVEKLIDVLDSKLDAGNEILSVLSDQFSQRHSSRLEWIVIWLVFVEVIIGIMELVLDMKPWFV